MKKIITLSREYGSGGRIIGEKTAERLGIPFYNRNIIDLVAHETGLDKDYINKWEEQVSSPRIWSAPMMRQGLGAFGGSGYYSNEDVMFAAQSKKIHELASEGPCVIVGRCAEYVLKDDFDTFNVFIYADMDQRAKRIYEIYNEEMTEADAEKAVKFIDKKRKAYHKRYADGAWGEMHNYDLCIDSGKIGIDAAVELIVAAIRSFDE